MIDVMLAPHVCIPSRGFFHEQSVPRKATLRVARVGTSSSLVECPSRDCEDKSEHEKADVPRNRATEIVAYVVDAEDLVVDQPLNDVEDAPSHEQKPRLEAEIRGRLPLLPGTQHQQHSQSDQDPGAEMKEAISQGVCFETRNRVYRVIAGVANHVMPLEQLVSDDAVDKPTQAQAEQQTGCTCRGTSRGATPFQRG